MFNFLPRNTKFFDYFDRDTLFRLLDGSIT